MRGWRLIVLVLVAGGGLAYFGLGRGLWSAAAPSGPRAPAPAIPVMASKVERTDVPLELSGLGTVQALNSVLVRSRVDGQIVKINFSEGKDVHAGDVLVEIDPAPFEAALAQAQANKLKNQALLDNARLDLDRAVRLAKTGATSTQQLDTAKSLVAQLEAAVKSDQAAIDSAQVQLNYSHIRAPIDGRAGTRLVDAGNIVRAADLTGIVTINQVHPIFVDFALPADSLPQIRARLKQGDVDVTAHDPLGRELSAGKLSVIDNAINAATGTIHYKAVFDNAEEVLWPGQFVNVRIRLETLQGRDRGAGDRRAIRTRRPLCVRGRGGSHRAEALDQDRCRQQGLGRHRRGPARRRAGGDRGPIPDRGRQLGRGARPRRRGAGLRAMVTR